MNKTRRTTRAERISPIRINTKFRRKLVVLFFAAMLALVALIGRITYINVTHGEEYRRIVLSNIQQQYESRTIPYKRGDITDRNGTLLATSERVYNLVLDCTVVNYVTKDDEGLEEQPYREPTLDALVKMFNLKKADIEKILDAKETKNSQYQIIVRDVSMDMKEEWESYVNPPDEEELTSKELLERSCINGVWFEESYKRIYPQNSLACDAIGFTYAVNEASWGIEGYYNEVLNGVNGRRFGYFNSDADVMQTIIEPENGNNVVSTIDINIQEIIREAIQDFQKAYSSGPNKTKGAKNISVLILDPDTGEILGMDSSNWYNLNDPRNLTGIYTTAELLNMTDEEKVEKMNEVWRNFCVSDAYEPGSVVKPLTVAAALETASVTDTQKFECDGGSEVSGIYIKCAVYPDVHGKLDIYGTIAQSCNDCIMQIVKKEGAAAFLRYYSYFGFGSVTGVDLPGENPGIIYTLDNMGELELATSSFGQGFTCTMVQEAAAIASVINGGNYYVPHIVSAITDASGNIVERVDPVVERQTVSRKTSEMIKKGMELSVKEGTGSSSKVNGYSMGSKTGTAEKLPRGTGDYLTSYIGFAPLDDPEVLIYVVVDEPNVEDQDTSVYAQMIAKQVLTEVLPYLGVFPDEPMVADMDEPIYNVPEEDTDVHSGDAAEKKEEGTDSNNNSENTEPNNNGESTETNNNGENPGENNNAENTDLNPGGENTDSNPEGENTDSNPDSENAPGAEGEYTEGSADETDDNGEFVNPPEDASLPETYEEDNEGT